MIGKLRHLTPMLLLLFLAAGCSPQIALEWVTRTPVPASFTLSATPNLSAADQETVAATLTTVVQEPVVLAPMATPSPTQSEIVMALETSTHTPTNTSAITRVATSTATPTIIHRTVNRPLLPSVLPKPINELVNQAGRWQVYTSANQVTDLAVQGGTLWAATEGGLVGWDVEQHTYAKYTTLDGLPRNSVSAVEVDSDGALWLGTSDGLVRWDGNQWTSFQQQISDMVHDLTIDHDGALWVASGYTRVARYEHERWTDYDQGDGLADGSPVAIAVGPDSSVWVAHESGLLSHWNQETWVTITVPINTAITDIAVDASDSVWVGSRGDGISRWDGTAWASYSQADGLADDFVQVISVAADGSLWIGTSDGASRWDGSKWITIDQQDGLASNDIRAITPGPDGSLWFGSATTIFTPSGGISRWYGKDKTWTTYREEGDGLLSNSVRAVAVGNDGSAWAGTYFGGLDRWDGKVWRDYYPRLTMVDGVTAIALAPNSSIWLGLDESFFGGVGAMRAEIAELDQASSIISEHTGSMLITQENGLASNWVRAITVASDGTLWFGTDKGLSSYDGQHWVTYTQRDGLVGDSVRAVVADPNGVLWVGTDSGLSRWDGESWTTYTKLDGLAGTQVRAIAVSRDGTVWCGTSDDGLGSFDGKTWTTYTMKNGLGSDHIASIAVAPDGDVWVGHSAAFLAWGVVEIPIGGKSGVSRWDGHKWTTYAKEDGLADNAVTAISVGDDGVVWIGTAKDGLVRFMPAQ